jgi:hypothetical protein
VYNTMVRVRLSYYDCKWSICAYVHVTADRSDQEFSDACVIICRVKYTIDLYSYATMDPVLSEHRFI